MCPPKAHRGMVKKVLPDFFDGVDHIVLFYFIVCYLLNIVLFYSKYDVCSRM